MTNLKDALTKKDEEITQLQARKSSTGDLQPNNTPCDQSLILGQKAASDIDNSSDFCGKQPESGSQQSTDELRHHKDLLKQSRFVTTGDGINDDTELLGLGDADFDDRLSDISDGAISMGTETDGSMSSIVESTLFPETTKARIDHQQK